jgi:hypothetical protein
MTTAPVSGGDPAIQRIRERLFFRIGQTSNQTQLLRSTPLAIYLHFS